MTFHVDPIERFVTDLGCLVETRRQVNAHGLEIEHVVLSVPDPQPIDPQEDP